MIPAPAKRRVCAVTSGIALLAVVFAPISSAAPQDSTSTGVSSAAWSKPDPAAIPAGPVGDSIRFGMKVFNDTPQYAEKYVGNKMACTHCHVDSGTVSKGMPMIGLPGMFPLYREREKAVVTFEERIEECFQRSEFGHRVPNTDPVMVGLVSYVQWLSKDQVIGRAYPGRGLVNLPELSGDAERGGQLYEQKCALCHGTDGTGKSPTIPALWGPDSYSDGAGMNRISTMAAFVQHNMPQTDPGTLTPQQAYDVATYVHSKPHSKFVIKDHE